MQSKGISDFLMYPRLTNILAVICPILGLSLVQFVLSHSFISLQLSFITYEQSVRIFSPNVTRDYCSPSSQRTICSHRSLNSNRRSSDLCVSSPTRLSGVVALLAKPIFTLPRSQALSTNPKYQGVFELVVDHPQYV